MATYPVAEKVKRGTKRQKDQTKIRDRKESNTGNYESFK